MYMRIHILQLDQFKKGQCPLRQPYKNNLYMYICEQSNKNITILKSGGGGGRCDPPNPPPPLWHP